LFEEGVVLLLLLGEVSVVAGAEVFVEVSWSVGDGDAAPPPTTGGGRPPPTARAAAASESGIFTPNGASDRERRVAGSMAANLASLIDLEEASTGPPIPTSMGSMAATNLASLIDLEEASTGPPIPTSTGLK
jgi:hypothetical protein